MLQSITLQSLTITLTYIRAGYSYSVPAHKTPAVHKANNTDRAKKRSKRQELKPVRHEKEKTNENTIAIILRLTVNCLYANHNQARLYPISQKQPICLYNRLSSHHLPYPLPCSQNIKTRTRLPNYTTKTQKKQIPAIANRVSTCI